MKARKRGFKSFLLVGCLFEHYRIVIPKVARPGITESVPQYLLPITDVPPKAAIAWTERKEERSSDYFHHSRKLTAPTCGSF